MSERDQLKSLERGLQALTILNVRRRMKVADLARELAVPRTTAERVLRTLQVNGYVDRERHSKAYFVTPFVCRLAAGLDEEEWVTEVGQPLIDALTRQTKWPAALSVPFGDRMLVRAATDHDSPFAIVRFPIGTTAPILGCASGHLFLAYCDEETRRLALKLIMNRGSTDYTIVENIYTVRRLIDAIRRQGYALRDAPGDPETTLGVPVVINGRFFAALTMRFIRSAVSDKELTEVYLPKLAGLADIIVGKVKKITDDSKQSNRFEQHVDSMGR